MRLHEYSVFARFRYNDLKVGISSGNQALKRCAFLVTDPTSELIISRLPVNRQQSARYPEKAPTSNSTNYGVRVIQSSNRYPRERPKSGGMSCAEVNPSPEI